MIKDILINLMQILQSTLLEQNTRRRSGTKVSRQYQNFSSLISPVIKKYYDSPECLFHTVRLLDTSEYIM